VQNVRENRLRMTRVLFLLFLFLQLLLTPALFSPVFAQELPNSIQKSDSDGPFDWVQNLGSPDWITREDSAEKLLEAGDEAVAALRSALSHSDLEVRERAKELLSILAPLVIQVDVVRLGKETNAALTSPFESIRTQSLDFNVGDTRMSTIRTKNEERRFQVSLRGTESPFSVEALFHGTSTSSMTGPPGRKLETGNPWVILSEDRVRSETSFGLTGAQSEHSTWLLLMTEAHQLNEEAGNAESRVKSSLIQQLRDQPTAQQIIAAAMWSQIPDTEFSAKAERSEGNDLRDDLEDSWLVARLIRKLPGSREAVESVISQHLSGENPMTAQRIDGLLPFAVEEDLVGAEELLYQNCADLSPWSQHLLWNSLDQKIRNGAYSEASMLNLLRSLIKPESLAVLRWSDSHMSSMWSALVHNMNTDTMNETLSENWQEIMGADLSQSTGRIPLFFLSSRIHDE